MGNGVVLLSRYLGIALLLLKGSFYVAVAVLLEDTSGAVELHDILVYSSSCDQCGTEAKAAHQVFFTAACWCAHFPAATRIFRCSTWLSLVVTAIGSEIRWR